MKKTKPRRIFSFSDYWEDATRPGSVKRSVLLKESTVKILKSPVFSQDIRSSGLLGATIQTAKLRIISRGEAQEYLGYNPGSECLIFPYYKTDDYMRLKPAKPLIIEDKSRKYLAPMNRGNHIYIPPPSLLPEDVLKDPSNSLILTEGEKKALKAAQEGFKAIVIPGVWSWNKRDGDDSKPVDEFGLINWKDRKVYITFDSDADVNQQIYIAEEQLCGYIKSLGGYPLIGRIPRPEGADSEKYHGKYGLDDLLAAKGPEALKEVMLTAKQLPEGGFRNSEATGTYTTRPIIIPMSDIVAEDVDWLWYPYIPVGKITLLEGDPDLGKTWLALQLVACVSTGSPFPRGSNQDSRVPANVIYLSAEDGAADTLRPRLDMAGANVERIFNLTGMLKKYTKTGEEKRQPVTPADLEGIEEALKTIRPALIIIDPLQAYLGARLDMHRANEVRPVLAGIAALADKYKCAVLGIRHLTKAPKTHAIYRGQGSIDIAAAARSVLLVGKDPQDKSLRVLAHLKSNLSVKGSSLSYEIQNDKDGRGHFHWRGRSDVTADMLLAPQKPGREKSKVEEAEEFLFEALANGPRPSKDIFDEAEAEKISESTLRRAKRRLPIRKQRYTEGNKGQGRWEWGLVEEEQDDQESE